MTWSCRALRHIVRPRCRPGLDPAQYRAQARPRQRSTSALCRQIRQNGSYSLAKNRIVHIDGVIIKAARRRTPPHGPIAQLDRVADFYSAGCRFESCWDRHCTLRRLNFFGNLPLIDRLFGPPVPVGHNFGAARARGVYRRPGYPAMEHLRRWCSCSGITAAYAAARIATRMRRSDSPTTPAVLSILISPASPRIKPRSVIFCGACKTRQVPPLLLREGSIQMGLRTRKSDKAADPAEQVCPACGGTGFPAVKQPAQRGRRIFPMPCKKCGGKGRIAKAKGL
jgi:hypothetical protein